MLFPHASNFGYTGTGFWDNSTQNVEEPSWICKVKFLKFLWLRQDSCMPVLNKKAIQLCWIAFNIWYRGPDLNRHGLAANGF